ncbi:MAG: serine hydrolase domain-containing protein [Anaerolineales bacterium]
MTDKTNPFATAEELKLMQGFPPPPDKCVDRSNALLTPPFNRWAYQHMRMIYPSAGIPSADQPIPIEKSFVSSTSNVSVDKPNSHGKPTGEFVDLETYLKETFTDAFVVIKGDQIVFEKFLNGMHANQPHQMMSATKSFAGLLGLISVEEGKLSEDDKVSNYVPELKKSTAFADATFGQVLDMTNSMKFVEHYHDPSSGIRRYGAVLGWTSKVQGIEYEDNLYDFLVTLEKDENFEHGEVFNYQTPKTDVVNWVTNRVNDQSFQDAIYTKLWSKLGTEGETYVLLDQNATLVAGGGLNATPNNLVRFAIMMINEGKFAGNPIVSPKIIQKLSAGASTKAFYNGTEAHGMMDDHNWSYRAQWWVRHTPGQEALTAIGIHGQWIYLDLAHKTALIKLSSQPESSTDYYTAYDIHGFDAVINYLDSYQ